MAESDCGDLLDAILGALPVWQVLAVQYNEAVAQQLGIAASDMQCLFVLSRAGPLSPGTIAERIGITTGSASRMVDRLLAAGLVTRVPHTEDRRRVVVEATQAALDRVAEHYDPLNARLREHLQQMDARALGSMLGFVRNAEKSTDDLLRALLAPKR